ncbi:MAG: SRPBCC family protein [Actinomycetes bacterium]|jgi:DivIVA domain-containing protein
MISTIALVFTAAAVMAVALLVAVGRLRLGPARQQDEDRAPIAVFDENGDITAESLGRVRFEVAPRGYRMDEVDAVIAALVHQLRSQEDCMPNSDQPEQVNRDSHSDDFGASPPKNIDSVRGEVCVELSVDIDADADKVWAALVNWPSQGEWMLGTRVWVTKGDGASTGSQIAAFSGIGKLGFLDPMTITDWQPPHSCTVLHTGTLVRGTGTMSVKPRQGGGSTFTWQETLELPWGWVGRLGWALGERVFIIGVRKSLDKFAAWVRTCE